MTQPDEQVPTAAVELSGVSKTFAVRRGSVVALQDIDLTIGRGEFVSLIGPSGCGKSTLLRIIADLLQPTGGGVRVNGKPARRARLDQDYGIAFQQAGLLDWRTVLANIELPLELHGVDRSKRKARALELVELVGLGDFASQRPPQLSGGMQQRVAIARALAESPTLLLMDEPFGALDEMTRERLNDELLALFADRGFAALFITHSVAEAVYLSTRVVVMSTRPGHILGDVSVPFGYPRQPDLRYTEEFAKVAGEVSDLLRDVPRRPAR
jgi:NitT/TauT family transport system ATP-binding protein